MDTTHLAVLVAALVAALGLLALQVACIVDPGTDQPDDDRVRRMIGIAMREAFARAPRANVRWIRVRS